MAITVEMIEKKEFKYKMRGFDPDEVNEFLDEICDEMIAMQDQIAFLQNQLRGQSAVQMPSSFGTPPAPGSAVKPAAPQPAPAAAPAQAESGVRRENAESAQKLLSKAQQLYDQMLEDARQEAESIVNGARVRAESDVEDLEQRKAKIREEIQLLKSAARDYKSRFQRLLEDQNHLINSENELFSEEEE